MKDRPVCLEAWKRARCIVLLGQDARPAVASFRDRHVRQYHRTLAELRTVRDFAPER